ncbi:MAG TPA: TRAM domain-containing protein, partial [Deltaproteobacteria bacterium]|nr:TRAM domain-containing protein [Deltaproteobacteria bacterium]
KELGDLPMFQRRGTSEHPRRKILDTSVIIDGRVPDICDAGFIEGVLVAPQFILNELQHIADSSDPLKRARGRRGLDILNRLQKNPQVQFEILDKDFPKIKEVDSKLIALAKEIEADVLTNDFNLNKVAQIQGVNVLNINQLANAVKPIVLPGETMTVTVTRQGKERGQGVAYLDDGTMVVVEQGESLMNQAADVVVTSILQTPAGRMIFAAIKNHAA